MEMLLSAKKGSTISAAALLIAVLLLIAGCSEDAGRGDAGNARDEPEKGTVSPTPGPETTAQGPPKITLGEEPGGQPEVVLRLEGGPKTTFSGLCSVGDEQNVLGGKVPKRFTFNPRGRELSCRIQKRDEGRGVLRIILVAGDTTRSVQQTNSPGSEVNVTYRGG